MLFLITENTKTFLRHLYSMPILSFKQYITVNGRKIGSLDGLKPFSHLIVQTRLLGGSLSENEKTLAMKRFTVQVCRKCNSRLSIRATHCRKRKCGFSNKLRMKKKLREVGKK